MTDRRRLLARVLGALLGLALGVEFADAASTVNPNVPATGAPFQSAPIRQNFQATATDITSIESGFAGTVAPSSPSVWQDWVQTGSPPWSSFKWDGQQWIQTGTFDTAGHTWTPYVGNLVTFWNRAAVPGSAGGCLVSNGVNTAPTFQACVSGASLVGTAPIAVTFPGGVATVALNIDATLQVSGGNLGLALAHANTWTAQQTFLINQNAGTSWQVANSSAGASALAFYNATIGTGNAAFGIGGTGYTAISGLQNRAFLNADSGTAGIVINNQGANPIIFQISNAEVGRWDTSAPGQFFLGVSGTTVGRAAFFNATSGSIVLAPPAGALGAAVLTLPAVTDTLTANAAAQTLTNKTLTSSTDVLGGVTLTLGSDATGDTYYRSSGGVLTRLGIGSAGNVKIVSAGLPAWGQVNLASAAAVTGVLPVANGGTNASSASGTALDNITGFASTGYVKRTGAGAYSFLSASGVLADICTAQGDILYYNGTNWVCLATGTAGQVLSTNGASANPSWIAAGGTGTVTSVVCAATTITTTGTCYSAGQVVGTATNDNATAGNFGEYQTNTTAANSLTSGSSLTVASVSLTAGDWDVSCSAKFNPAATTSITTLYTSISQTNNTLNIAVGSYTSGIEPATVPGSGNPPAQATPIVRASLSGTTIYYCVVNSTFSVSTLTADGLIRARRVR